ncbi:MAG TPA: TMEM175 family protein [Candidatus Saccharimonadales bacterium]|nr:TMEM175 family protein [Candidatus Saccharimonadales bacterium]
MDTVVKEEKKINREIGNLISEDRIVNFSDAVFAFAATLLVLKIDLPQIVKDQLTTTQFLLAFQTLWPQYLANIISFLVIGYYWLNHHAIFGLVRKFDAPVVWINLLFLILVSFLPFPVDLYGDFLMVPIVVVFYSASLALVGYLLAFIWWYASHKHRLINKDLSEKQVHYYLARNLIAPIVFTLSIPLVYIHPLIAQFSWVFVIVGIFVVNDMFQVKKLSAIEKMSI